MDGNKTYQVPPGMAYPPPTYYENIQNPNTGYNPNQGAYIPPPQYGVQYQQGAPVVVTTQPMVVVNQVPFSPSVPDYLGYSIFIMLCCCCPLGVAALVNSISTRESNSRGQRSEAERSSRTAWILNNIGLGIGIAISITWIVLVIVYIRVWNANYLYYNINY